MRTATHAATGSIEALGALVSTPICSLADRWRTLHAHAAQVARLAQLSPEPFEGPLASFAGELNGASEWQRDLAQQGIEDIEAMMRPGLAALEIVKQRGAAATAPALALWREFYNARCAVMALMHAQ